MSALAPDILSDEQADALRPAPADSLPFGEYAARVKRLYRLLKDVQAICHRQLACLPRDPWAKEETAAFWGAREQRRARLEREYRGLFLGHQPADLRRLDRELDELEGDVADHALWSRVA